MILDRTKLILGALGTVLVVAGLSYLGFRTETVYQPVATPVVETPVEPVAKVPVSNIETIGTSVEGRSLQAFTYGTGDTHLVFIGGIHGGYEWNSVLLSYQLIDYLEANPSAIPSNLSITVIPSANPDGLFRVIGKEGRFTADDVPATTAQPEGLGRFNANNVDLNRNFACKWKPESVWRGKATSAGTTAFSEPEALAIKNFLTAHTPDAVIFYHSQSNAIYASECENGILPETRTLMSTYASATGYPAVDTFDAYEVTGDAEGWLASIQIPAITVELKTHEAIEWDRNLAGVKALFEQYSKQ